MPFSVAIRQCAEPLAVEPGQTILDAALQKGIDYPHNCRAGNCGACKSRLHSGEIEMSPYSAFALTDSEKESGLILACRAVPWSNCDIAWLSEEDRVVHAQRDMRCEVHELIRATHDIMVIRLKVVSGGPYRFSAGQFADVEFHGLPARRYSMANRPDQSVLEFHVRVSPGGQVSTYVTQELRPGTSVQVRGPAGASYLRVKHTGPILAIAGGSGLAPIKAIVETALYERLPQPIHMYFGVRDERDIYLERHFQTLAFQHPGFKFTPVVSQARGETKRRTGWVTDAVKQDFPSLEGFKAYVCGPPTMVEAAQRLMPSLGVANENLHADAFYTDAQLRAQERQP